MKSNFCTFHPLLLATESCPASTKMLPEARMRQTAIAAIDLFCGAGGLTRGLQDEGIQVVAGVDCDPACRHPFEYNNGARFIERGIADITAEELLAMYPRRGLKLLAGCAPCQPFSTYVQSKRKSADGEWELLDHFARLAEGTRPELVTMENVPQLAARAVFDRFVERLENIGYRVTVYPRVSCPHYGVPQTRKRLVLFASVFGPIELLPPTHATDSFITVRDTIARDDLEPLAAGQTSATDPMHRASKLSAKNLMRIRTSRPGGTWREWDDTLVARCHRKKSGKTYPGVYGRMDWDEPAPTITTQCFGFGNGRFGHPEQDRALSLREAALLQTFSRDYEFVLLGEPVCFKKIGRLIGNAVPVRLARVIAKSILQHTEEQQ